MQPIADVDGKLTIAKIIATIDDLDERERIAHLFAFQIRMSDLSFDITNFFKACNLDFWGRSPAEIALSHMPASKQAYARKVWSYLTDHSDYPSPPSNMPFDTAVDIWVELCEYDRKTGQKVR